jgi:DNA-binding MarR family transcriptional regulator
MTLSDPERLDRTRLESYLPYRLTAAAQAVSRLISGAYQARFNLTLPQWRLMAVLIEAPISQSEAAARLSLDKAAVSRASHLLIQRGLAVRTLDGIDGRSHALTLTPAGCALYDQVNPAAAGYERALSKTFTAEEIRHFKSMLARLEQAASELCDSIPGCPEKFLRERDERQTSAGSKASAT